MTVASYFQPASRAEAVDLLDRHGADLLVIAGGTVAMPLINEGISLPTMVMGLRKAGLDGLSVVDGTLRIGATATLTALTAQEAVPMLQEAARSTASWSIRNMATVGGNAFTPPPGGDVAVALLALDASVALASVRGVRTIPLADLYTGFMTTALAPDELLVELSVPTQAGGTAYEKFGRKHADTPAVVTVAARLGWTGDRVADARIALGAVGPHPLRAQRAEALLIGSRLDDDVIAAASQAAVDDSDPFTDAIATAWYRRRMTALVVARVLGRLAGPVGAGGGAR